LTFDPALNTVDKALAADKYCRLLENNRSRSNQIKVLIEVISLIAQKHHQLIDAGTKLNSANFKGEIGRVSRD